MEGDEKEKGKRESIGCITNRRKDTNTKGRSLEGPGGGGGTQSNKEYRLRSNCCRAVDVASQ